LISLAITLSAGGLSTWGLIVAAEHRDRASEIAFMVAIGLAAATVSAAAIGVVIAAALDSQNRLIVTARTLAADLRDLRSRYQTLEDLDDREPNHRVEAVDRNEFAQRARAYAKTSWRIEEELGATGSHDQAEDLARARRDLLRAVGLLDDRLSPGQSE
jgi:hypothetical protein